MATIHSFRELRVHEDAFDAAMRIYRLSKAWPREERFELTSQIRRSSRSVCACTAEAWRKRRYPAAFIAKLSDAEAEAAETRVWLDFALACGHLDPAEHRSLDRVYDGILAQLVHMIDHADQWAVGRPDPPARKRPGRDREPESGGSEPDSRAPHPQSPSPENETNPDSDQPPSAARIDTQSRRKAPRTPPRK